MIEALFFTIVIAVWFLLDSVWKSYLVNKLQIEKEKTKQMRLQNDVNLDDLK